MTRSPTLWRVVVLARGLRPLYVYRSGPRPSPAEPPRYDYTPHRTPAGLFSATDARALAKRVRRQWRSRVVKIEPYFGHPAQPSRVTGEAA